MYGSNSSNFGSLSTKSFGSSSFLNSNSSSIRSGPSSGFGSNECAGGQSGGGSFRTTPQQYEFIFVQNAAPAAETFTNLEYLLVPAAEKLQYLSGKLGMNLVKTVTNAESVAHYYAPTDGGGGNDLPYPQSDSPELYNNLSDLMYSQSSQSQQVTSSQPVPVKVFVIGSFYNNLFSQLQRAGQKIVGPLVIEYWLKLYEEARRNNVPFNLEHHLSKVTPLGLFSECMNNNVVYISQEIESNVRMGLMDKIRWMGGTSVFDFTIRVTHAVVEELPVGASVPRGSTDPKIRAANFFSIPLLSIEWVNNCWIPVQLQYHFSTSNLKQMSVGSRFEHVKPKRPLALNGLSIGILDSVVNHPDNRMRHQLDQYIYNLHELVVQFGGKLLVHSKTELLRFWSSKLLLHVEDFDVKRVEFREQVHQRYRNDRNYVQLQDSNGNSVKIVTIGWLIDSVIEEQAQSFEPYLINPPPGKGKGCGGTGGSSANSTNRHSNNYDDEEMTPADSGNIADGDFGLEWMNNQTQDAPVVQGRSMVVRVGHQRPNTNIGYATRTGSSASNSTAPPSRASSRSGHQ